MRPFFVKFVICITKFDEPMIIHPSFPDFVLFLYVHMSEADSNYDPSEIAVIREKMPELFPGEKDLEKKLYNALKEYMAFDKSKLKELFEDTFHHFNQEEFPEKGQIYRDLQEIIKADGKVDKSETKALQALTDIIDFAANKK